MRSGVLLPLLAALLAARLRPGNAEGDPLPASLVDLVRNSPIASVEDLKLLLQQETSAAEESEDEHDIFTNQTRGRHSRSLVEAQPAQQAACKVRTEVMEVTRSMLDRRNANFLLWPPCVEVQRCSGCCNTRLLQCVPTVTASRFLQVIKIQYVNKKALYDKAIISVEDHVSCRCQPPSSSSNPPAPPPQLPPPSPALPRTLHPASTRTQTSKADLHRHDDLKHNQQHHEPATKQWQQGGYAQLVHWTQPRLPPPVQAGVLQSFTGPAGARAEHSVMGSGYDGSREETHVSNGEGDNSDHVQRQQQLLQHQQRQDNQQQQDRDWRTQFRLNAPQSDGAPPTLPPTLPPTQPPTVRGVLTSPPPTTHKDSVTRPKPTEQTRPAQTETKTVGQKEGSERDDGGSANSGDPAGGEKGSTGPSEDGRITEEERRQKLLEMVQTEPDGQPHLHPHLPQQRPKPTAAQAALPAARQAPFRPASPRRRRKHRKRISKAAMRAMIM